MITAEEARELFETTYKEEVNMKMVEEALLSIESQVKEQCERGFCFLALNLQKELPSLGLTHWEHTEIRKQLVTHGFTIDPSTGYYHHYDISWRQDA